MSTHILDIELSVPLPTVTLLNHEHALLTLVRWHDQPIGLVWMHTSGQILPAELEAAIRAQVTWPTGTRVRAALAAVESISIVVCTHERPDDLRRCLNALMPLAQQGHEVLVVDNAPRSPRTALLVEQYPFRYVCEPRIGLNNARNCGLRAAGHAIVAYADDDVVVDPNWAAALAQPFGVPEVGCVTGLVLPLELQTCAQEQFEVYCTHRRTFDPQLFSAPPIVPAVAGVVGMGANMAVRKERALRLGGFDPRLDAGTATYSGGDTDMFARVLEAGRHIVYTPDALVWHRHRREPDELHHCIFGYGVGLYSFLAKRLVESHDLSACVIGVRWLVGPFIKAAWRRGQGQRAVPFSLLLAEARGACLGPVRFWQAHKADRRVVTREPWV